MTPFEREADLRLECLKLAAANPHITDPIGEAQRYYDFVSGKPALSPREQIIAAMEAAGVS